MEIEVSDQLKVCSDQGEVQIDVLDSTLEWVGTVCIGQSSTLARLIYSLIVNSSEHLTKDEIKTLVGSALQNKPIDDAFPKESQVSQEPDRMNFL